MKLPAISEPNAYARPGYTHIAFRGGSKDVVDKLTAQLEKDGHVVKSYTRTAGAGHYESSVYDLDSKAIEITE